MLSTLNITTSTEAKETHHTYTTMSPEEWAGIPNNPRQRDTERHLKSATHLLNASPTHMHVIMAFCPSTGQQWKLDGHTRSLLWTNRPELAPERLFVTVYTVASEQEAAKLYTHFDNTKAAETPVDRITGAYRALGWKPASSYLALGSITWGVTLAEGISRGQQNEIKVKQDSDTDSIYTIIANWLPELKKLDTAGPTYKNFNGQLLAAALLTMRRRGSDKALPFWELYIKDQGLKLENEMDGVEALTRIFQVYRANKRAQSRHSFSLMQRAISCFEAWRTNKPYIGKGSSPKPTDAVKYMERAE